MYRFARNEEIDLCEPRLRKMTDEDLLRFGKAARFMCRDKSPRQAFVIQLEEARPEWRRVVSRTGAILRRVGLSVAPRFLWVGLTCLLPIKGYVTVEAGWTFRSDHGR